MLSKRYRFHRRNAVGYVHKTGNFVRGEHISVRYVSLGRDRSRYAVVVSKKIAKSAVVRNRIRRRIFAVIELYENKYPDAATHDMVFMAYSSTIATMKHAELEAEIIDLFNRSSGSRSES